MLEKSSSLSYEGSPWSKVPQIIDSMDVKAQQFIDSIANEKIQPWKLLHELTESSYFIAAFIIFLLSILYKLCKKNHFSLKQFILFAALYLFMLICADSIARELKDFIGRLKPFETDALRSRSHKESFPSNHATNIAYLIFYFSFLSKKLSSRLSISLQSGLIFFALLLAISRVFFGEHYPLDISAGLLLGLSLAYFTVFLSLKLLLRVKVPKSQ